MRRSARILLVDTDDRILLFRFARRPTETPGDYWITPGGGVHEAEPLARAAARELREETGLVVTPADIGTPVAVTGGYADIPGWLSGEFRDVFFFCRTAPYDIDTAAMETFERGAVRGHRWWTLDELSATSETIYPLGLAALLPELIAGRLPAEPVTLPWHH